MKVVWKVLTGVALVAALLIAARVIMYGVGSLPFMNAFSAPPSNTDSEAKSGGAVARPAASTPSNTPTEPARTYQPPPAPVSGQTASQPSSAPNPPSMYERARRAGNRPNSSPDD